MSIRIYNNSVSAVVRSYAIAPTDKANVVVWLDLAPQHPKVIGAIWASLVNGTNEELGLRESASEADHSMQVQGLHARYIRLTADAPRLAGRARPRFLRLVAPSAVRIEKASQDFYVFAWPNLEAGTALAAMLEAGTPTPMQIGWGSYLLSEAVRCGFATPLLTGGPAPDGFWLKGDTPWAELISDGVRRGELALDGAVTASSLPPMRMLSPQQIKPQMAEA